MYRHFFSEFSFNKSTFYSHKKKKTIRTRCDSVISVRYYTGAAKGGGGHGPPEIGFTRKFLAAPLS